MKLLTEQSVELPILAEQARLWCGCSPTDEFSGEDLDVGTARDIAAALGLPGIEDRRVVTCSFQSVFPRAADVLLRSVEEQDASLFFATPDRLPETLRSRFRVSTASAPTLADLHREFARLSRDNSMADLCAAYPQMSDDRIHSLYDRFMQSVGPVSQFLAAVHDGNYEAALKCSLQFDEYELDLLYTELELQLLGESLIDLQITRIPRTTILEATRLREARTSLQPPAEVALLLFYLL